MPPWTALATLVIVIEYYSFAGIVALYRRRTGIQAPAMVGHPDLERAIRVHLNTLEKLAVLLPAMWITAWLSDDRRAATLGAAWAATRVLYAVGYLRSPRGRALGSVLGDLVEVTLLVMAGIGVYRALA